MSIKHTEKLRFLCFQHTTNKFSLSLFQISLKFYHYNEIFACMLSSKFVKIVKLKIFYKLFVSGHVVIFLTPQALFLIENFLNSISTH